MDGIHWNARRKWLRELRPTLMLQALLMPATTPGIHESAEVVTANFNWKSYSYMHEPSIIKACVIQ